MRRSNRSNTFPLDWSASRRLYDRVWGDGGPALAELASALVLALLALLAPLLGVVLAVALLVAAFRTAKRVVFDRRAAG